MQICLFPSQLVCLVIMDSVLLVFSVIDSAYLTAFEHPEPAWYKALFPYFWHPFKNMATTCCAYMVVAVAAERYQIKCYTLLDLTAQKLMEILFLFQISRHLSSAQVQTSGRALLAHRHWA